MKIYFIGGGNFRNNDLIKLDTIVVNSVRKSPRLTVLPWSRGSQVSEDKSFIIEYFTSLGVSEVYYADISDSPEKIAAEVSLSDIVYLPGGDTQGLISALRDKGLEGILRTYDGTISGNSAGALSLCTDGILTDVKRAPETKIVHGIGLVDFSVAVHYEESKDSELLELSENRRIYAIPEKCALVLNGNKLEYIGNIYLFHNGKKEKLN